MRRVKNAVVSAAAAAAAVADRSTAAYVRALTRAEDLTYRLPRGSISAYPSRLGIVRRAPSPAASGQTSTSSSSTRTDAVAPTDARTRARARSPPTSNWIPRPYKIAKRTTEEEGRGEGGERRRRREIATTGRRRQWRRRRQSPFSCVREDSRDRRPTTRAAAKSGRFISVNASAESRTRGQTERKRVKKKEEDREE